LAFITLISAASAQTFEINGQSPQPAQQTPAKKGTKPAASSGGSALSWGTSIDVSRQARAAEQALKRGDYATAANFAEKAANPAPQNGHLWFMYGYAARLSGRYNESIAAFNRGLKADPKGVEGLSGLAQTYAKMGKFDEAKRLLNQLLALD